MKRLGRWIAETPSGRMAFRIGAIAITALAVYLAVFAEVGRQTSGISHRIHTAEVDDPCVILYGATKAEVSRREIRRLTPPCVSFLDDLGPLISLRLTCAILRQGGYECPKPESDVAREGVVAGSGNTPHGQPSPAPAGEEGKGTSEGTYDGTKKPPSSEPPSHAESLPPPAETELPSPGNSGEGASAEHGVKACVELAASACVEAGGSAPVRLP